MEIDKSSVSADPIVEFSSAISNDTNNFEENTVLQNFEKSFHSDAVCKFISGEISFNDYLNRVAENGSDKNNHQNLEVIKNEEIESTNEEVTDSVKEITDKYDVCASELSLSESESNEEDNVEIERVKRNIVKRKTIQRSKLSPTLKAVMGQANVYYAKGDTKTAVKMCLEIIKEEPNACEPFKTLASIYEEIGEQEKSLQMRLIAAHVGPANKDEWYELAQILKKNNQLRQAILCYTKAINLDVLNLTLYEERAALMKEDKTVVIEAYGYPRLLYKLDAEKDGQTLLYLCKKVAKLYYNEKKFKKSCNILKYAFEKCPDLITNTEVNLFLDVLITTQNFDVCLNVLSNFCGVDFKSDPSTSMIKECIVPEDIPVDIRAKLIITLIHFECIVATKIQMDILLQENPEIVGDLFLDISEVLIDKKYYEDAVLTLIPLTNTESFNTVVVWFKLALCYKNLNKIEECHRSYKKALEYFPENSDVKVKYCHELVSAKLYKEAIEVTLLDNNKCLLIYERCKLYLILNDIENFIETGWNLFRLHCKEINSYEDYRVCINILHFSKNDKSTLSRYVPVVVDDSVSLDQEYEIFEKICNCYIERKDYDLLQKLTLSLYVSFKFLPRRKQLRIAVIVACLLNNDYELGFDLVRFLIVHEKINSQRIWNIFNTVTLKAEYNRLHKFLLRYLLRNPKDDNILTLYANNCLLAGTYKYALNDYTILFESNETPLLSLLIALNLLHVSCQKFSSNKHALVSQVIVFLKKYEHLRGSAANQEIFYNVGRAFHQLELLPEALFYYKKALTYSPPINDTMFDLKCDIAYNLHLIYLNSGQYNIANWYLQKYIII